MREWLSQNSLMGNNYRNGSWVAISDIQQYIENQLDLEQRVIRKPEQNPSSIVIHSWGQEISAEMLHQDKRNKFIWGIYNGKRSDRHKGNHYTGYLHTPRGIYLFDSMKSSYVPETPNQLDDFIKNCVGNAFVAFQPIRGTSTRTLDNGQPFQRPTDVTINARTNIEAQRESAGIIIKNRTDTRMQRFGNKIMNWINKS